MKEIKELVDGMKEELCGAEEYAKKYINLKQTNIPNSKKYKEMAEDELKHAMYLHEMSIEKSKNIEEVDSKILEIMNELWKDKHDYYITKVAEIKVMLTM